MATKSDLLKKLAGYGEQAPSTWTVLQLRSRLTELKDAEKEGKIQTLEGEMAQLKKASAKKVTLIAFLTDRDIQIPEHATISRLFNLGEEKITLRYLPNSTDLVGFGKHGNMTYRQLKEAHPACCRWVVDTSDSPHWRLVRLASWLDSNAAEECVDDHQSPISLKGPSSSVAQRKEVKDKNPKSVGSASSKDKELAEAQVMIEQLKKERSELEHQLIESRVHVKSRRET